ncbi:MAG: DUF4139 domain-containing protein [bacterium]
MKKLVKRTIVLLFTLQAGLLQIVLAQDNEVSLTVYNDNLALVREVRTIALKKGVSDVRFQDVASRIDPTSVYFSSLTAPEKVMILEQNYEYDLVNSEKILQKYLDQKINITAKEGKFYSGTLLSAASHDIILQEEDGKIKIVNRGSVETMDFPKLPDGLITRPTLVWSLDCQKSGDHKIEVGYLTSGIQWHAEYVGVTNKEDSKLDLGAWVSIDNKSGATYENAKLKVVAGDVHRARAPVRPLSLARRTLAESAPDHFEEKAFFEYHLYTLQRRTTVTNHQVKQISLIENTEVAVAKKYAFDGARDGRRVRVNLEFENKKRVGLGIPLPAGKIRIYKEDDDKSLIFIGEDFIEHTPKDEKVRIYVGNAFDIVGERTQKDRRSVGKNSWEETWEIKLRNHKDAAVAVAVVERLNFDWEIGRTSHEYQKKNATTIEFSVEIPQDGEGVVEYVVRYNR